MDLRSIIESSYIEKTVPLKLKSTFTKNMPPEICLDTIDDLMRICEYFGLPVPSIQIFEDESKIEELIYFLKSLRLELTKIEIEIPEIKINEMDVQKSKNLEREIDNMEIRIANIEENYNMLNEFRNEICRFYNKDVTITADLVSTSTTYDVRNNNISNVFLDNNEQFANDKIMSTTFKDKIDTGIVNNYMKALNNLLNELKSNPYLKYREEINSPGAESFSQHRSYVLYKNIKRKQFLLTKLQNMEDSTLKLLFLELVERKIVYLSEMETKYELERVEMFKIVYYLEGKGMIIFDKTNECVRLSYN